MASISDRETMTTINLTQSQRAVLEATESRIFVTSPRRGGKTTTAISIAMSQPKAIICSVEHLQRTWVIDAAFHLAAPTRYAKNISTFEYSNGKIVTFCTQHEYMNTYQRSDAMLILDDADMCDEAVFETLWLYRGKVRILATPRDDGRQLFSKLHWTDKLWLGSSISPLAARMRFSNDDYPLWETWHARAKSWRFMKLDSEYAQS